MLAWRSSNSASGSKWDEAIVSNFGLTWQDSIPLGSRFPFLFHLALLLNGFVSGFYKASDQLVWNIQFCRNLREPETNNFSHLLLLFSTSIRASDDDSLLYGPTLLDPFWLSPPTSGTIGVRLFHSWTHLFGPLEPLLESLVSSGLLVLGRVLPKKICAREERF